MGYSELIKKFERIRTYLQEFYIYGFKTRDEYDKKSTRSYDNERRRIESYLSGYIDFKQTKSGKNVFLSIDSGKTYENPFYKALKSKSFTSGDITLHFLIFDILYKPSYEYTVSEIMDKIDEYMSEFDDVSVFDISTVRKKLKEYTELGLVKCRRFKKQTLYSRAENVDISGMQEALEFFSEYSPCGIIGNFILDKYEKRKNVFSFKHHYISRAIDSEILCSILEAINSKRCISFSYLSGQRKKNIMCECVPVKVMASSQNSRQYMFAYNMKVNKIFSYRIDRICNVNYGKVYENFDKLKAEFESVRQHMWGVSLNENTEHVEFTVQIGKNEMYIYNRLYREKRCGKVEWISENECRFTADISDSSEILPWIRTFICRITDIEFSNKKIERKFMYDLNEMYKMYGVGEEDVIQ